MVKNVERAERWPQQRSRQELKVARAFVKSSDIEAIALRFGTNTDTISEVLTRPKCVELVRKYSLERLLASVPASVDLLYRVVSERDPKVYGVSNQLIAARLILDRTDTKLERNPADGATQLADMSREDLQAEIERLESEVSERASDITPNNAQKSDDLADLL